MELSRILANAVELEKRIARLYTDTQEAASDAEVGRVLKLMSRESQIHAQRLASRHGAIISSQSGNDEAIGLVAESLGNRVASLRSSTDVFEVIQESIAVEKRMEKLYRDIARILKESEDEEASKVLWQIAMEEKEHQRMLSKVYEAMLLNESRRAEMTPSSETESRKGSERQGRVPRRRQKRSFKVYILVAIISALIATILYTFPREADEERNRGEKIRTDGAE